MANENSQETHGFVAVLAVDTICAPDGTETFVTTASTPGLSEEAVIEATSKVFGVEPGNTHMLTREQARRHGSAAFMASRWNSSWQPSGGNPSYN